MHCHPRSICGQLLSSLDPSEVVQFYVDKFEKLWTRKQVNKNVVKIIIILVSRLTLNTPHSINKIIAQVTGWLEYVSVTLWRHFLSLYLNIYTRRASGGVQNNYKLKHSRRKKITLWRHCFSLYFNFGKESKRAM